MEKGILVDENCGIAEGGWWQGGVFIVIYTNMYNKKN